MPQYDYKMLVLSEAIIGAAADEYAYTTLGNVVDFGATPSASTPSAFYPLGITKDPAKLNMFGLHVIITTAFLANLTSALIWIVHGTGATPTTLLSGRYFTLAQLAVLGAHYFIPCAPGLLRYASLYFDLTGVPAGGAMTAYFGPDEDGTI